MANADKDLPIRITIGLVDPKVLPEITVIVRRLVSSYNNREDDDLLVKSYAEEFNKFKTVYHTFYDRRELLNAIKLYI